MPIPLTTVRTDADATAGRAATDFPQPNLGLRGDVLFLISVTAINLACFYRTLKGYFVADDFIHVSYLDKVFSGHPELLVQNFYTNWMQTHGTQFYRPLVSLSMAADWWLGGGSATMFHVTNTLLQIGSAFFLYLLTKRLLRTAQPLVTQITAFVAAALFSAYPLHAEVVSWAIGRVDSLCTLFYLGAFWLFLKGHQDKSRPATVGSLVLFTLGLMSKEMAITLPATLSLYCLFAETGGEKVSIKEKLSAAVKSTWFFWATLAVYFGVRVISLGTIFGGYSGSIGESMGNSFWKRWFQDGSLRRVLFPINIEVFAPGDKTSRQLLAVYGVGVALLAARALAWRRQCGLSRYFFFALLWFVLAMAPTYNVWNLTENLQGSRFIYLGSAPLCLALALLFVPVTQFASGWRKAAFALGAVAATALVLLYCKIATIDNLAWTHAFTHVTAFRSAVAERVSKLPPNKKLVLLNVPQKQEGAHMVYNGAMLGILLSPPLTKPDVSRRVISFEPMTYGFPDLIAPSRLRALGREAAQYDFVSWNRASHKLEPLKISAQATVPFKVDTTGLNSELSAPGAYGKTAQLISPRLSIPAMSYDLLKVRMTVSPQAAEGKDRHAGLYLFWNTEQSPAFTAERMLSLPLVADGKAHDYVFHIGEHKSWLASNNIEQIQLELPFLANQPRLTGTQPIVSIESIELQPAGAPQPIPNTDALRGDDDGVYRNLSWPITFTVPNTSGALVEISKESSWFEHYTGTYRDDRTSAHALKTISVTPTNDKITLQKTTFPSSGYYQIRAFALKNGAVSGYSSDPINLQLTK